MGAIGVVALGEGLLGEEEKEEEDERRFFSGKTLHYGLVGWFHEVGEEGLRGKGIMR